MRRAHLAIVLSLHLGLCAAACTTENGAAADGAAVDRGGNGDAARPPGDSAAPATDSAAPGTDSATPGTDGAAPGADSAAPGGDSATPGGDSATPAGDSAPPSGDSTVDAGSSSGDLPRTPDLGPTSGIVINHNHVALFEQIPAQYLAAARNIKMVFSDRSVGQNIHESLDCLTAASYGQTPVSCRRDWVAGGFTQIKNYTQSDYNANQVPAHMRFTPDPVRYDRSNWKFEARTGSWSELTGNFITQLAPQYINQGYQVLSYQFSYLNVDPQSDIASPSQGFFVANASKYDIKDLEAFWAQHPTKTFVLWTASLARGIGSAASRDFNQQMRQYATQHNMILFDMADITSHTPSGAPCFDNRDGVQYCSPTNSSSCENHPDDGVAYPAICRDYTTELDGGHLGSVGGARVRIAKAMWVLMARIAGWTPN